MPGGKNNVLIFKTRAVGSSESFPPVIDGFGRSIKPIKKEDPDDFEIVLKVKEKEQMPKAAWGTKLMQTTDEKYQEWLSIMANIRFRFPENGLEIDRCVFDVGQKFNPDDEISFEEFHRMRSEMFSMSASLNGFYPDGELIKK